MLCRDAGLMRSAVALVWLGIFFCLVGVLVLTFVLTFLVGVRLAGEAGRGVVLGEVVETGVALEEEAS